jgi:hypothetical protein
MSTYNSQDQTPLICKRLESVHKSYSPVISAYNYCIILTAHCEYLQSQDNPDRRVLSTYNSWIILMVEL